jgi:hypothetical protein
MRRRAAAETRAPKSFSTRLRTGLARSEASIMPMCPPSEVPTQSTCSTSSRAISAAIARV